MRHRLAWLSVLFLLAAVAGCGGIKSRIHEHEAEFMAYPPQVQAEIQGGHIDRGFTEEMVYMAKGNPSEKTNGKKNGRAITIWLYPRPAGDLHASSASNNLSTPYGYPGIATGPAQPAPLRYDTGYYKVEFEHGRVIGWDEGFEHELPDPDFKVR